MTIYATDGSTRLMRIVPFAVPLVAVIGAALRRAPPVVARGLAATAVAAMPVVAIDARAFARRVDGIAMLKPRSVDVVPTNGTCTTVRTRVNDLVITPLSRR